MNNRIDSILERNNLLPFRESMKRRERRMRQADLRREANKVRWEITPALERHINSILSRCHVDNLSVLRSGSKAHNIVGARRHIAYKLRMEKWNVESIADFLHCDWTEISKLLSVDDGP